MSQSLVVDDADKDVCLELAPVHAAVQPLRAVVVVTRYKQQTGRLAIDTHDTYTAAAAVVGEKRAHWLYECNLY